MNCTPEEDYQLTVAAETEQRSRDNGLFKLKRKRKSLVDPKHIKMETKRLAERHLEQINVRLNTLQSSFGLHSFLVIAGEGFQTMVTGSLINPSLAHCKIFSKTVMSLFEFQDKLESVATLGNAAMKNGLNSVFDCECVGRPIAKAKPMQVIRMKELGDTLRGIFGKYMKLDIYMTL